MTNLSRFETAATSRTDKTPRSRPRLDLLRLQKMIDEMHRFLTGLDEEIAQEEERAHIHDESHFTYPIAAKAMRLRRGNLAQTIAALEAQLHVTRDPSGSMA